MRKAVKEEVMRQKLKALWVWAEQGGDGRFVLSEAGIFASSPLEDVVDEAVHDGHGPTGDAGKGLAYRLYQVSSWGKTAFEI